MPTAPQSEQSANCKERPLRIFRLDSGLRPPTASQLRRRLDFPGDRCDVAVHENAVSEAVYVTLQLERPPMDRSNAIRTKRHDFDSAQHIHGCRADRNDNTAELVGQFEELEERCRTYEAVTVAEYKDIPLTAFALVRLPGDNTFIARFDSARTAISHRLPQGYQELFFLVAVALSQISIGEVRQVEESGVRPSPFLWVPHLLFRDPMPSSRQG
ncbi:hypothetical protein HPB52_018820 [Rhipicephalus sanguineus]|uniref:Uncharacterized protein n=1 Tax=Rhipicephalus sanguineus TaxID=34632 RepID=A0A9D4PP54_RHISA|nr:hypothetical protein HPB52_018820 [Rhipicephalus sanguineus]